MPKRLTDTDKWKKKFIKSLPTEYKLFWLFLLDECDHSGIWHIELEVAEARLGVKLSLEKIRGLFKEKVVEFDGGTKWFIPDFIDFQYGALNPSNKAHKAVLKNIHRYNLKGLGRGLEAPMDKDKDKDKDKGVQGENGSPPTNSFFEQVVYTIEHCAEISLRDERWTRANKTNKHELQRFNQLLESRGDYEKNPADYKKHFANWKRLGMKDDLGTPASNGGGPKLHKL